jgi:N-methylhydantoinase A
MLLPALMDLVHVRRVIVPPHPGLFSALGLLSSDLVYADNRSAYTLLTPDAADSVDEVYRSIEDDLLKRMNARREDVDIQRTFDGRLFGQTWETPFVEVPDDRITADAIGTMIENFHQVYEQRTGNRFDAIPVQGVTFRVQVVVHVDKVAYRKTEDRNGGALKPERSVTLRYLQDEEIQAAEYQRDHLKRGDRIEGPAVIREALSTTHVGQGQVATVGDYGELVIERRQEEN